MSGFMSGLSGLFDVGTQGHGGFVGRTVIMAVVGGTAAVIGGGKFANGAIAGAFMHMFNAEMHKFFKSVSANIDKNIKQILWLKKHVGLGSAKMYFYSKVRPHGAWDYKRIYGRDLGEDLGNFNYGATGKAAGFSLNTLLRAAGFVQETFGSYSPEFGHFYGSFPYGDDPSDQWMIMYGYYYAK